VSTPVDDQRESAIRGPGPQKTRDTRSPGIPQGQPKAQPAPLMDRARERVNLNRFESPPFTAQPDTYVKSHSGSVDKPTVSAVLTWTFRF
jgi:hypothetical protein